MAKSSKGKTQNQQHQNDRSRALNTNKGTSGVNLENSKAQGNRGAQLNPNRK